MIPLIKKISLPLKYLQQKEASLPQPYWNPYSAGIGLGLVLLASFFLMGRGIGVTGAFSSVIANGFHTIAPAHAEKNKLYNEYKAENNNPLTEWIVIEVAGVIFGGFISGLFAGRVKTRIEKGPLIRNNSRFLFAFIGGAAIGIGSKLARGCTSGQALTGGALLNTGSWAFMISVFISAYAFAYFFRRQWR